MKRFAEAILLAAKIREESFNQEKADKMEEGSSLLKDFRECYTKTLYEAADKAAGELGFDKQGTQPIYLLLQYCWNDILSWAETVEKD